MPLDCFSLKIKTCRKRAQNLFKYRLPLLLISSFRELTPLKQEIGIIGWVHTLGDRKSFGLVSDKSESTIVPVTRKNNIHSHYTVFINNSEEIRVKNNHFKHIHVSSSVLDPRYVIPDLGLMEFSYTKELTKEEPWGRIKGMARQESDFNKNLSRIKKLSPTYITKIKISSTEKSLLLHLSATYVWAQMSVSLRYTDKG